VLRLRLAASSRLEILGQAYRATGPFDLRVQDGALLIPSLPLVQEGGARQGHIELHGRASPAGQTDLHLTVSDRELTTLPGLRDAGLPMRGWFDARLRLSGDIADPALSGEVTLKDVALAGRALGGGALTLTDPGRRSVRVRGTLFESFALDGTLADRPGGPTVNVTLTMDKAALDPLLPDLPPLSIGRATASGRVTMDVRPGRPAVFEGQFTELALSYQLPSRARRPAARVGIHSTSAVDVRMSGWGAQMSVGESGFDFGAGSLRAGGTLVRGALQAFARGPIDLARLAPVADAILPGLFDGWPGPRTPICVCPGCWPRHARRDGCGSPSRCKRRCPRCRERGCGSPPARWCWTIRMSLRWRAWPRSSAMAARAPWRPRTPCYDLTAG
jgi:hypothetical protein